MDKYRKKCSFEWIDLKNFVAHKRISIVFIFYNFSPQEVQTIL